MHPPGIREILYTACTRHFKKTFFSQGRHYSTFLCRATGGEQKVKEMLTVNNDLDHPEIYFSPGHDAGLTVVHALIYLLDAADQQVAIIHDLVSH